MQRRLALTLGITQVLAWGTTYYVPATMVGAVSEELGASRQLLLGGFSWAVLLSGLCAPWIGQFIDRHGGRPVLAAGQVVTALGLLVMASAHSVPWWYAAWTILGVGMALALYDTAFSTIGRLLGAESRPAMTGVTLIAGFGGTLGFPLGTWLVANWGWRPGLVLYAAIALFVILPLILWRIPRAGPPPPPPVRTATDPPAPSPAGRRRIFLLLATFFTLRQGLNALLNVHLLLLFTGLGLSTAEAVFCAMAIGPAQVGSRLLEWQLGRRLNPLTSAWIGAVVLPVGVALVLGGAPVLVFAICHGISNGILTITRGVLPMHVFGPQGYGAMMGRLSFPSLVAQAATPTLLAPVVEFVPAIWILAGMGVVSALALLCLVPLRRI